MTMEISIPPMRENPIYDVSNNGTIYDIIPEISTLKKELSATPASSPREPLLPPSIPPPREKAAGLPFPGNFDQDEYITMSSASLPPGSSPRYSEPPVAKTNLIAPKEKDT